MEIGLAVSVPPLSIYIIHPQERGRLGVRRQARVLTSGDTRGNSPSGWLTIPSQIPPRVPSPEIGGRRNARRNRTASPLLFSPLFSPPAQPLLGFLRVRTAFYSGTRPAQLQLGRSGPRFVALGRGSTGGPALLLVSRPGDLDPPLAGGKGRACRGRIVRPSRRDPGSSIRLSGGSGRARGRACSFRRDPGLSIRPVWAGSGTVDGPSAGSSCAGPGEAF